MKIQEIAEKRHTVGALSTAKISEMELGVRFTAVLLSAVSSRTVRSKSDWYFIQHPLVLHQHVSRREDVSTTPLC